MSVLHICCNLARSSVFQALFETLRGAGLSQKVFVPEKNAGDLGRNAPEGVETHSALTVRPSDSVFFFMKARRSVPELRRRVSLEGVSLVHAHTLFTDGSIALRLKEQTGLPYAVTLRYSDDLIYRVEPQLRALGRRVLAGAERVVFLSEGVRARWLSEVLKGEMSAQVAAKSRVIPNGLGECWLGGQARERLREPVRVGFAGLYNRRKRPLDAIAAVHAATARGGRAFCFRAVGSGPLEGNLRAALAPGDKLFPRAQGFEAMRDFYAGCDLLLVPSSEETFGMVYLEAMSQGVPVVYTRGQGFDGQFPEGVVGYSAACGDIREQADRLIQLADGYAERSRRCVELAAGYAWPIVAGKWMEMYREIGV